MKTEIANKQKCLMIRNSVEIWMDEEKWEKLEHALKNSIGKFYDIEGRTINVADIVGIFLPVDLDEMKCRKNGQWKCDHGQWHNRGETCECYKKKNAEDQQRKLDAQLAGDDVSEEQRINNLKKFREKKDKIFNNKK